MSADNNSTPVYLVMATGAPESQISIRYAAKLAKQNRAQLAVLYVMPPNDLLFMPWQSVSEDMELAQREEGERVLEKNASDLNKYDLTPALYLRKGNPAQVICDLVKEDPLITQLILTGDSSRSNHGPLVTYFTGKGLADINVPILIIPSHIDDLSKE